MCAIAAVPSCRCVVLVSAQVSAAFRAQRRPLPPWRTRTAMLSRWSPGLVRDIAKASAAALAAQQRPDDTRRSSSSTSSTSEQSASLQGSPVAVKGSALHLLRTLHPSTLAAVGICVGSPNVVQGSDRRHHSSADLAREGGTRAGLEQDALAIHRIGSAGIMARGVKREGALAAALRASSGAGSAAEHTASRGSPAQHLAAVAAAAATVAAVAARNATGASRLCQAAVPPAPAVAPATGVPTCAGACVERRVVDATGWAFHFHKVRLGACRP